MHGEFAIYPLNHELSVVAKPREVHHFDCQKPTINLTHSTNPSPGIHPNTWQGIIGAESSGPSAITAVSWYPPYTPYFFHNTQHICPRVPRGLLIGQAQEHHVITAKLLTIGPRVAIYEAFCPGILPYPCPGQVIHQEALTGRENQSHLRYLTASTRYHHGLVICEGAAKKRAVYLGRESVAVVGFHAR